MRSTAVALALLLLVLAFSGCVQPRFTGPDYSDPYGGHTTLPEKRWWAEEKSSSSDFDLDRFMFRWPSYGQ
jgi:hypothetical protein